MNYPRTKYEMTQEDLDKILDACKPTPCIMIGGYTPPDPRENANRAWQELAKRMGFEWDTVRPIEGMGQRFFTAIPSETEAQAQERVAKELSDKRAARITALRQEIAERRDELEQLLAAKGEKP